MTTEQYLPVCDSFKQEKRRLFEGYLKEQNRCRQLQNEKKRTLEAEQKNPEEHMLFIQRQFRNKFQQMDVLIQQYKEGVINPEIIVSHYVTIKDYYVAVSYVLKTYDRQFYKETLEKIHTTMIELRKKREPKRKFKFSRRNEDFGVQQTSQKQQISVKGKREVNIAGIDGRHSEKIVVDEGWHAIKSYKITSCTDTEVQLLEKTQILFLKNLQNCVIRTACTKSAVFVDNCTDCVFELNCHQLRIHNTTKSTFGIFVTSKAIIQDCNEIIFTEYFFAYPKRVEDQLLFERSGKTNLWREVQDFNWLKENQKSPHFTLAEQ